MSAGHRYDPVRAERVLGPAAIAKAREDAAAAPPLSTEVRERLRTVFASARVARSTAAKPSDAA